MAKKQMSWKTKGMNRDLSVSAFNPEFAFENRNLRLSTNDSNTLMSWVNEKGTREVKILARCYVNTDLGGVWQKETAIIGQVIGTAVLNHLLVLFTHAENDGYGYKDRIYSFKAVESVGTSLVGTILFYGNLNFAIENPIETLVSYESESIQKVYWTDKRNLPRVINIAASDETIIKWNRYRLDNNTNTVTTFFDFVRTLKLNELVYVKKIIGASGTFPAGVLQYAFTYFDLNGQESCIFYTTPLLYISYKDRGGSPESKIDNAFRIKIKLVDTDFDCVRIYSIIRTSINSTPLCKRVLDISTKNLSNNTITFVDTGAIGDSIDPTELLYKGGEEIIAGTMEQKDGTLFFGDIGVTRKPISTFEKEVLNSIVNFTSDYRTIYPEVISTKEMYPYSNLLTSYNYRPDSGYDEFTTTLPCGGFKRGESYRLGIQFQYKTGKWSDPIYYRDAEQLLIPNEVDTDEIEIPIFTGTLSQTIVNKLLDVGYKRVRGVCVYPGVQDRRILCQGVVNLTMCTGNHKYSIDLMDENSVYPASGGGYGGGSGENHPAGLLGLRGMRRRVSSDAPTLTWSNGDLHAQSSWFFRSAVSSIEESGSSGSTRPISHTIPTAYDPTGYDSSRNYLLYTDFPRRGTGYSYNTIRKNIRSVEILGSYDLGDCYYIDDDFVTFHSPDIEFDTLMLVLGFDNVLYRLVGYSSFTRTLSDINILTKSAPLLGSGFIHRSFNTEGNKGIISGPFWNDCIVDDESDDKFLPYSNEGASVLWMVYLWNKSGSLNNDIVRPIDGGEQSAVLDKKIISNLRITSTKLYSDDEGQVTPRTNFKKNPKLYNSEEATMLKFGDEIYRGNIDEILISNACPMYFAGGDLIKTNEDGTLYIESGFIKIPNNPRSRPHGPYFTSEIDNRLNNLDPGNLFEYLDTTMEYWNSLADFPAWTALPDPFGRDIGDKVSNLALTKDPVHIKYKSTPHLVFKPNKTTSDIAGGITWDNTAYGESGALPIIEITLNPVMPYGGGIENPDVLQSHFWIPCGEPTKLEYNTPAAVKWEYGDTYYQRWDCLKTYAFTPEDENQVVEIGSFMLETRVNVAGRYDTNRGQLSNLYMNPRNFNLLNPVYSLQDNFFTYRIQDKSYYESTSYPNLITWSKTKISGADVDQWTNITLANNLELDGDKGSIKKLIRFNDLLFTFLDTGISLVLYNERMQLTSTEGVPVEIANSGKVDGKRYISNTIGCSNKWSIAESPMGIYFIDSNEKSIYVFNGLLNNISAANGFNTWCKKNIPAPNIIWDPVHFNNFVSYYDKLNQEVLFINDFTTLAYSEKIGAFTSFYDYGDTSYFCNLDDVNIWAKNTGGNSRLWKHQGGEYCNFFGEQKDYGMILVSNPEPQTDKIFTNLEFRACTDNDGVWKIVNEGTENEHKEFTGNFYLPFDYLETWNEYLHGIANLQLKNSHGPMRHHINDTNKTAHLARKFRIWRCDIPRDNLESFSVFDATFDDTFHYPKLNRKRDRMRNPWLYIKLKKNAYNIEDTQHENPQTNEKVEIHDFVMTYYN